MKKYSTLILIVITAFVNVWVVSAETTDPGSSTTTAHSEPLRAATGGAIFTVDSNGDLGDANIGDGVCATTGNECTLRAAIEEANDDGEHDQIHFDLPDLTTIQPTSSLPTIRRPVTIDGATNPLATCPTETEPGYLPVLLNGGALPQFQGVGLRLNENADGSIIRGLNIVQFEDAAISLAGFRANLGVGVPLYLESVEIECNHIGIDNFNSTNQGNGTGISVGEATRFFDIGGEFFSQRNVISGNEESGIVLWGRANSNHTIRKKLCRHNDCRRCSGQRVEPAWSSQQTLRLLILPIWLFSIIVSSLTGSMAFGLMVLQDGARYG